jgi:hypothetical protein
LLLGFCGPQGMYDIVVGSCASGYTLLGIAVGSCGASGNTPYWVLLIYVVPRATHFTGYCCWFMRGLGQYFPPPPTHYHYNSMGTPTATSNAQ